MIAADEPEIEIAATEVRGLGASVKSVHDDDVVTGFKNKVQSAVASITPAAMLAKQHRKMAEPGTAKS